MKKNSLTFIVLLFSVLLISACQSSSEQAALNKNNTTEKPVLAENKESASYKIEGMACEFGCAKFIEKKIADLNGIINFKVDFELSEAKVTFDNSKISNDEIVEFVEKLNDGQYKIKRIENASSDANGKMGSSAQVKDLPTVKSFNISFPKLITYFTRRL